MDDDSYNCRDSAPWSSTLPVRSIPSQDVIDDSVVQDRPTRGFARIEFVPFVALATQVAMVQMCRRCRVSVVIR